MEQQHHPVLTVVSFTVMLISLVYANAIGNIELSLRLFSIFIAICCSMVIIVSHWDKFKKTYASSSRTATAYIA